MRKPVLIIAIIAALALLGCIAVLAMRYREERAKYDQSVQAEEALRDQFNAALQSIAEIQDSLTVIAPEEARLRDLSGSRESGTQVTQTQKERMLSTIADLKESIKNTKQKIRDLEKSLQGSQAEVVGLKRIISNLKRSVAEREAMIQRLTAKVDSLSVAVAVLKTDVRLGQEKIAAQEQVIEEKRKEIGTIYYIVGTKKELKQKGIILESGGVIGIGKSAQLSGAFTEGDFMPLDTDRETGFRFQGKEPRVLSAQSPSSYELRVMADHSRLNILRPEEFRKTKYLVILVK